MLINVHTSSCNPYCGTGGFLTSAIEHKRENYVQTAEDEKVLQSSIYGRLCCINM